MTEKLVSSQPQNDFVDIINGKKYTRMKETGCYLCGKRFESRRISVPFGMYAIVAECPNCHLAFQSPQPSPEASLEYMNWRWKSSDTYVADKKNQLQRAISQVHIVEQHARKPIKLIDFGAGAGSFVRVALNQGWDAEGVEQSISARTRAKDVHGVDLVGKLRGEKYNVATMWDVIEHLRDPIGILKMIREHLTDDGVIFIETGNYENWHRIVNKDRWGLYLFDHQFYFSPISLQEILHRAGFSEFLLLNYNHIRPSLNPIKIIKDPFHAINCWRENKKALKQWPEHGDINVMIVMAKVGVTSYKEE